MTKKDYIAIAAILNREIQKAEPQSNTEIALMQLMDALAIYCEQDNPQFDADKFTEAVLKE